MVAQALVKLATGTPYAEVSRWAKALLAGEEPEARWPTPDAFADPSNVADDETSNEDDAPEGGVLRRLRPATSADVEAGRELFGDPWAPDSPIRYVVVSTRALPPDDADTGLPKPKNAKSAEAHNVWHQAADWVEVFSPVLWLPWHERMTEQARENRAQLDALIERGERPRTPQVLLLDSIPVYDNSRRGQESTVLFHVLVAAEVVWRRDKKKNIYRDIRLRLARGFATADNFAWRLVLDELGYVPDYVVSDAAPGLTKAVRDAFGPRTILVPSQFHIQKNVVAALTATPGAWYQAGGPRMPLPELDGYVRELQRGGHAYSSVEAWSAWWDELLARMRILGLDPGRVANRKRNYEPLYVSALPHLLANTLLPATTGGLETLLTRRIDPVLSGRGHVFTNIERTNRLLDLVVLYDNDQLLDVHKVADRLRDDSTATQGWAAPVRYVNDPAGANRKDRYKSLLDPTLPKTLAKARGLA